RPPRSTLLPYTTLFRSGGQYLGAARTDLFIRTPDRSFATGYFKAILGTWLMAMLVIILGTTASTFVKGPVATLLTFTLILTGLRSEEHTSELQSRENLV